MGIRNRLLGNQRVERTEEDFLNIKFDEINLSFLELDFPYENIINQRIEGEHFQNSVKKNQIKSVKKFELFERLSEFSNFKISFYLLAILKLSERFSFAYFSLLKRKVKSITTKKY